MIRHELLDEIEKFITDSKDVPFIRAHQNNFYDLQYLCKAYILYRSDKFTNDKDNDIRYLRDFYNLIFGNLLSSNTQIKIELKNNKIRMSINDSSAFEDTYINDKVILEINKMELINEKNQIQKN